MNSIANTSLWLLFGAVTLGLLALDLFVFHRTAHVVRKREALTWSIVWIAVALGFNTVVYWQFGSERGFEFLTGYLVEKALAVDNLFVFVVIFSYFRIPAARQHRVLLWGVVGAVFFRALFISLGTSLLRDFHWIAYVLGAFLALTGIKLLKRRELHPETNLLFRMVRLVIPVMQVDSDDFVVRQNGRLLATPLLLSLMLVEISDLVFAIDSIPAIFAITPDPFIVFTSNIFAVLGLRAMYSLVADFLVRFRFLHVGLALVLVFVGAKMLLASVFKISAVASLAAVVALMAGSAMVSVLASRPQWRASPANAETPRAQKL